MKEVGKEVLYNHQVINMIKVILLGKNLMINIMKGII